MLNNLLAHYSEQKNMVIENEFGAASVDGGLVNLKYDRVFELNNGCICCSLGEELYAVLRDIAQLSTPPDNVFIEASGMADPGALASVFIFETISEYFTVKAVIGVVDAVLFEDSLAEVAEAGRQLAIADLILLNKEAMVTKDYIHSLVQKIKHINPLSMVFPTNYGNFTEELLEKDFTRNSQLLTYKETLPHEHSNVKSIKLDFKDAIFDLGRLRSILTVSLFLHYHQIYRIKGFVHISESKRLQLVQSVGQQLSISPVTQEEEQAPFLVVIGKGLTRKGIEKLFAKGLDHETTSQSSDIKQSMTNPEQ
ncbi:cobalamin synthesis protein CobW [Echinicola rosea]|uniref:Cobalamin synthesis protein CobW n=1 Tax=Echinicola rosea TaxID=1807691 RepID=A0ABQ1UUM0_9BACT|nr:cobalamin synthesis protein CobW [Echinicola rosea]